MSAGHTSPASPKRRWFLKTALVVGAAAGALGGGIWWRRGYDNGQLTADGAQVFRALARGILGPMLPQGPAREAVLDEHLASLERLLNSMPKAKRDQITLVTGVLSNAPTRYLAAGLWTSWDQASDEQVREALKAMQMADGMVPNVLFAAARALTCLTFFSQPSHWEIAGYPGPMSI